MIQITSQLSLSISTDFDDDIINTQEFGYLSIHYTENLPVAHLQVNVKEGKLESLLPQDRNGVFYYFSFGYGNTFDDSCEFALVKWKHTTHTEGITSDFYMIGFPDLLTRESAYYQGSSDQAIYNSASLIGGIIDKDCQTFQDRMVWIQNSSTKRFWDLVQLHSYSPNTYLLLGYTDKVILRDVYSQIHKEPKWKFSLTDQDMIPVAETPIEQQINDWPATKIDLWDLNTGSSEEVSTLPDSLMSEKLPVNLITNEISHFYNRNVHEKYFEAYERNRRYFASRWELRLVVQDTFYPFKLFDPCFYHHPALGITGHYLIKGVKYNISLQRCATSLWLWRESRESFR